MPELLRAGLLAVGFVAILVVVEAWYRTGRPPVELTRKVVHLASGLPVLAFPWIFQSPWSVLGLSAVIGGVLWAGGRSGVLGSVHDVERTSRGELLYPLGIVLLFFFAHDRPVFYLVSVLVLIVSDPTAALVGLSYGRTRYAVEDHWRSLEGSVGFFLMTFLAVHLPLLLMAGLDPAVSVLVALLVAILVTLFEAVCLHGADNLAIPLATWVLLEGLTPRSPGTVALHLAVLLGMLGVLWALARGLRFMKASGVMASTLYFYFVFLLAGPEWMLPPALAVLLLAGLRFVMEEVVPLPAADYQVVAIFYATLPTLAVLVALHLPGLLGAPWPPGRVAVFAAVFAGAVAGQLAIMAATQFQPFNTVRGRDLSLARSLALGAGSVAVMAPITLWSTGALGLPAVATAGAVAGVAIVAYWALRTGTAWPAAPPWNFRLQALVVGVASLALLALVGSVGA